MDNILMDCFSKDAEDSKKCTAEDLFKYFTDNIEKLQKHLSDICQEQQSSKVIGDEEKKVQMDKYVDEVISTITKLKHYNCLIKHKINISQELLNEKRLKVDKLSIRYQDLLREKAYLQNEVTKCLEFKSLDDQNVDLLPMEEFLQKAPKEFTKDQDEHQLHLNRLRWELEERKRLGNVLLETELKKEKVKESIQRFKNYFKTFESTVDKIIEAAKPLQSKLGLPFQAMDIKHKMAEYLPLPLYYLYIQMAAYNETCSRSLEYCVLGDVNEAQAFQRNTEYDIKEEVVKKIDASGNAIESPESLFQVRAVYHDKDMFAKHPLSVHVFVTENGVQAILKFSYLINLNVATINVQVLLPTNVSSAHNEVWNSSHLLSCLYPNDNGAKSPNSLSLQLLINLGFSKEHNFFSHDTTGWPYCWVQNVAGLYFLPSVKIIDEASASTPTEKVLFVEKTFLAVMERIKTRFILHKQIVSLGNKTVMETPVTHLCLPNVICKLQDWSVVSLEEIAECQSYKQLVKSNIINPDDGIITYKASIKRDSAELLAYIVIYPDYPAKAPLFLLAISWTSQSANVSDFDIRELEAEINVKCIEDLPKEHSEYVLTWQFSHLLSCFDIFLETNSIKTSSFEFPLNKAVARMHRGPHQKPYMYNSSNGIFSPR